METAIRTFLTYLDVERGASRETIRSYTSDLRQFVAFLKTVTDALPEPSGIDASLVRRFLVWLAERKDKKASQARKLATLRSLFKFLHRRGEVSEQSRGERSFSTAGATPASCPDERRGGTGDRIS